MAAAIMFATNYNCMNEMKNFFSLCDGFFFFCDSSNYKRLVSTSYECPFFRKSFKIPFMVSLRCMSTT